MKKHLLNRLKKLIENDELMFKLGIASKFAFLTAFFAVISFASTYLLLKIDLIFFEAHGYPIVNDYRDAYYTFVYSNLWDRLPYMCFVFLLIFLGGYYIAIVMIRPFKIIGQYCEERMNNETRFYEPDLFSDLKLLTSFSSFFFAKIDEAKIRGKLSKVEIPEDYTNIHKPMFEKNFFLNYSFLIVILGLMASVGILILNNEIRDQVMILTPKLVRMTPQVKFFIDRQFEVVDPAILTLLVTHLFMTILFGIHLYQKISSPAFAVFATLRSFIKGNHHNRIHLIGYYYLRNDCRKINKYLDQVQKDLT